MRRHWRRPAHWPPELVRPVASYGLTGGVPRTSCVQTGTGRPRGALATTGRPAKASGSPGTATPFFECSEVLGLKWKPEGWRPALPSSSTPPSARPTRRVSPRWGVWAQLSALLTRVPSPHSPSWPPRNLTPPVRCDCVQSPLHRHMRPHPRRLEGLVAAARRPRRHQSLLPRIFSPTGSRLVEALPSGHASERQGFAELGVPSSPPLLNEADPGLGLIVTESF